MQITFLWKNNPVKSMTETALRNPDLIVIIRNKYGIIYLFELIFQEKMIQDGINSTFCNYYPYKGIICFVEQTENLMSFLAKP